MTIEQRLAGIEDELDALYTARRVEQWDAQVARRRAVLAARRRRREVENEAAHSDVTRASSKRVSHAPSPPAAQHPEMRVDLRSVDLTELRIVAL